MGLLTMQEGGDLVVRKLAVDNLAENHVHLPDEVTFKLKLQRQVAAC